MTWLICYDGELCGKLSFAYLPLNVHLVFIAVKKISSAQLVFGDTNMVLEFNRVTVWETALENSDFANALVDKDYVANNATLTQGWYNVKLTIASKILTTELSADLFSGKLHHHVCQAFR